MKLTWLTFTQLLLQYGLPLTMKIVDKWGNPDEITDTEKAELREMAKQTPQSVMIARLTAAGVSLDSPEAKALLALIPPNAIPLPGI